MLVQLKHGQGSYGKLWTGTALSAAHEDPINGLWDAQSQRVIPNIVDATIIERRCECGATTRKFRAYPVEQSAEARKALDVPTCFVTAGGVGSIYVETDKVLTDLTVWNWSGRVGGHVILNPVMIRSGYVSRDELPTPKPGYVWACTYSGSTLSEYVLLPVDQIDRALPIVKLAGECPPCRQKREEDEAATTLPEPVELANDGTYALKRVHTAEGIRYQAGCRNFNLTDALAHWREDGNDRAKMFHTALLTEQENATVEAAGLFVVPAETPVRARRERGERGERGERRRRSIEPENKDEKSA